ncbi:unnamed protein product [Cuscuta epithymum]|uniref:Uncharacterized protein n=2 Tax=Cuscuta epithymum TaxID=186058 RepID=A0AAV0CKC6_9ASTE|nr:unnamed protein product [Cuscuta epithymum]
MSLWCATGVMSIVVDGMTADRWTYFVAVTIHNLFNFGGLIMWKYMKSMTDMRVYKKEIEIWITMALLSVAEMLYLMYQTSCISLDSPRAWYDEFAKYDKLYTVAIGIVTIYEQWITKYIEFRANKRMSSSHRALLNTFTHLVHQSLVGGPAAADDLRHQFYKFIKDAELILGIPPEMGMLKKGSWALV